MELNVHPQQKIAEIWMTHADRQNPDAQAQLQTLCSLYKQQKYTVAVYHSGSRNLYGDTLDLLRYNRRRVAELVVKREKSRSLER